jgi:hypothetical protein
MANPDRAPTGPIAGGDPRRSGLPDVVMQAHRPILQKPFPEGWAVRETDKP